MKTAVSGTRKKGKRSFLKERHKSFASGPTLKGVIKSIAGGARPIGLSLLVGVSLFGLYIGVRQLVASPVFKVRGLQWSGLQHLSEPEMAQRFQSLLGQNLFQVEMAPIQRMLLANPWVKAATVRKDFPDRLTFIVEERTPASVAYPQVERRNLSLKNLLYPGGTLPEAMRLLDREGVVLDQGGNYPPELPRVVHVNAAAYPKALRLAELLTDRSDFLIDLSNPDDLQVHLPAGVIHFGAADYSEKWNRFAYVEEDLRQRGFSAWEVDLRFSDKVIVKGDLPVIKKNRTNRSERL